MKKKVKPKRGRPRLPTGEGKTKRLQVRLTPDELAVIEDKACAKGMVLVDWVRQRLLT